MQPRSRAPYSQHEQFLFLCVSVHFILFRRFAANTITAKSLFRPLAPIKPKACCIRFSSPVRRGSRGHFDRANCLNPRALFAELCIVPRNLSLPPVSRCHFPSPLSLTLFPFHFPFSCSHRGDLQRLATRLKGKGGKQGCSSVTNEGGRRHES